MSDFIFHFFFLGSSVEFSQRVASLIEKSDDPVVRQRGQSDGTALRERGYHIPARPS